MSRHAAALHMILLISLLAAGSVSGADIAMPLTLEDALRAAAESHPSVALKIAEHTASEFSLDSARWQRWPGVSMSSSRGAYGRTLTDLQVEQPLWSGGRITAAIHAAEARVDVARSSVAETQQMVLERTVTTYAEAMRLQQRLAAATAVISDYNRLSDMIERRVASGISPRSDGITARTRLQQALGEQLQMKLQLQNARTQLEVLVGRKVGELSTPHMPKQTLQSLDDALDASLAYAPELNRLSAEERVADESIAALQSSLSPSLALRYQRTFGGGTIYPTDQLFVGVTFQPGSGLSSLSSIKEAQSRRSGAIHSREATRRDIVDRVRGLWNLADSSRAELKLLTALGESTQQVYESYLRQFPAGRRSWLEVLLARRDATQAQYSLADTQWMLFAAVLKLEIFSGRLATRNFHPEYESAQ